MFTIKSIVASIHDTSYGGYPFKVVVNIDIDSKKYAKLPVTTPAKSTLFGRSEARRDLSSLVLDVNAAVQGFNRHIPAYNPFIDSKGSKSSRNGIKPMEFIYFFKNENAARCLGFEFHACGAPKTFQTIVLK